jgi:H+-transporting ATPase
MLSLPNEVVVGLLTCSVTLFQAELTNKMEQKIPVLRDGKAEQLLTRLLVPGDVVLLMGGAQVPADIEWMEGDVLSVDTAALTGEPLPRKYPSEEHGNVILCACTIRAGEAYGIVRKTGVNTEIGSSTADIMKDKTGIKMSVFETRVLLAVKIIICLSLADVLIIFLVQGFARDEFNDFKKLLLTCLSIIIAAIPVALPLVMQVTMALGAGKMARDFDAVVTSLPALQDISSMTILCSDKTGTLTTARITIHAECSAPPARTSSRSTRRLARSASTPSTSASCTSTPTPSWAASPSPRACPRRCWTPRTVERMMLRTSGR